MPTTAARRSFVLRSDRTAGVLSREWFMTRAIASGLGAGGIGGTSIGLPEAAIDRLALLLRLDHETGVDALVVLLAPPAAVHHIAVALFDDVLAVLLLTRIVLARGRRDVGRDE